MKLFRFLVEISMLQNAVKAQIRAAYSETQGKRFRVNQFTLTEDCELVVLKIGERLVFVGIIKYSPYKNMKTVKEIMLKELYYGHVSDEALSVIFKFNEDVKEKDALKKLMTKFYKLSAKEIVND